MYVRKVAAGGPLDIQASCEVLHAAAGNTSKVRSGKWWLDSAMLQNDIDHQPTS